ncbi:MULTISPECIES: hypothetical protein [unclassified Streptomyces]|uniref:hypothetical protein n=1 Tax=unclassified Streptomyces TaxID=2593676 RepID=UPI00225233CB|nr:MULTISPECIES: hypothetical protein [unclassified Streptomyces]MCX5063862.1 MmcQ/YjbR family DNA-binding protein [Streptomyces sp. NBC_00452]
MQRRRAVSPEKRYAQLVAQFAELDGVTIPGDEPGREGRFGAAALKVGGKIFAMLAQGHLVVKLPRARVDELVDAGEGERFDPGHGRLMSEWLSLNPGSELSWDGLAHEALDFISPAH